MADIVVPNSNPDVFNQRVFPGRQGILNPENIEIPAGVDDPAFGAAREALSYVFDGVEKVDVFRGNPNEEWRAARHDRETRELADQTQATYNEKAGQAEGQLDRAYAEVERRLIDKAGMKSNPAHFDAITSAFYQMKPGQRAATIAELIEQGENAALAIIIEAPLFLTGVTAEQRDGIKERVFRKVDPQGVRLRDGLAKAKERLTNAHIASLSIFDKLRADTHVGAAKDRAARAAARNMAANASARR